MKQYKLQDIRNIGFVGHGGSGKTSLAESVLFLTEVSDRLGKVGDTSSVMDYDPDEIKRGHSINSSVAFCEFNETKINLIDTPGSSNFIADTPAALRVVDGLVFVVSAVEGVQFYTEKIWKWADELNLPRIIFLNKMDHERANISSILETIKNGSKTISISIGCNIGEGNIAKGLEKIETSQKNIEIGCYPWFRAGLAGTNVVIRSMDKQACAQAAEKVKFLIKEFGGEPQICLLYTSDAADE